jgi:iron complex transport system substrate-binding protein
MRVTHGWHVAIFALALVSAVPARAAPQHVVSVLVCTDEYVFRLLPRERIAALSYLAADRHPVVSTIADEVNGIPLIRQNAEAVLARHPDLVVTYQGVNQELHTLMRTAGVPVLDLPWANSLDDVRKVTRLLGGRLGEPQRAEALLAEMDRKLAAAHVNAPSPPVATLIYEPNGYITADGVTDEILNVSGLHNAGPDMHQTRLGTVPVETIVATPPELLILNDSREASPARADMLLGHPALAAMERRISVTHLSLTPLLCPGPWSADAAAPFAALGRKVARMRRAP